MFANKLSVGDEIRVIAPSRSLGGLNQAVYDKALSFLTKKGFRVTFSKNSREMDESKSSSIQSRVEDLHDAFLDKNVKVIMACNGGSNVNQILDEVDYNLIKNNPKILCGFSDIAALLNAIYTKTGLVTYHGPLFSFLGYDDALDHIEYTYQGFEACLMKEAPFEIEPSEIARNYVVLQEGTCEGEIVGGNLCTLNLLQGTDFMPELSNKIVFLEDSSMDDYFVEEFDRNLQSLIQTKGFSGVKGIVFGRFGSDCKMNIPALQKIVATKKQLHGLPIICNVDFGHELPFFTFPIGGTVKINAVGASISMEMVNH